MSFDVNDHGKNDYTVTNNSSGRSYDVHVNNDGSYNVSERSGGGGLPILIFLPILVVAMPIIFFTQRLWEYGAAPVPFIASYIVCVIAFIFIFFPSVKEKSVSPKAKIWLSRSFSIILYLLFIFSAIIYFTLDKKDSQFLYVYIMPIVSYGLILYHVKDFHLIPPMMKALKIKRWSFIVVYLLQWLLLCVLFYFGIMETLGEILGDFLAYIICYMYMIFVDVKKFILHKKFYFYM